jgi:protoporphyrinogen/coproporphyrinogen III oxidase
VSKQNAKKLSFDDGLQVLTDALHHQLVTEVKVNSPVIRVKELADGWAVTSRRGGREETAEHAAVLFAGPAFKLPEIQLSTERYINCSPLSQIHYPPVASVVLGFRREDVAHPLDGFGMLIPEVEGFKILGTLFSSSLFPNRAPEGHVTLTSYVGGTRAPDLAAHDEDALVELTLKDLRTILGVTGPPTFVHHAIFPHAIPQYEVGYGRFKNLMSEIETKAPGFFLAGHYRDGISLSDSIVSGYAVAAKVEKFFVARFSETRITQPDFQTTIAA